MVRSLVQYVPFATVPEGVSPAAVSVSPQAKKAKRPVQMACTKTATLWVTEAGSTFYEGVATTLGGASAVEALPFPPADGIVVKHVAAHRFAQRVVCIEARLSLS